MAKKQAVSVNSLSFLDIMACGFGAVIIVYIMINQKIDIDGQLVEAELLAEVKKIEEEVKEQTENLIILRNTAEEQEDEIVTTEQLAIEVINTIRQLESEIANLQQAGASQDKSIEELISKIKKLEEKAANVAADKTTGSALRFMEGEGNRQYLTGMKLGGQHILILLDSSASMLDKTLVNIIRRRNMPDEQKLASKKWQRAIKTVEWITANMPNDANFQLFTFNAEAKPAIPGTDADWLRAAERADTDGSIEAIKKTIPQGGTSLHNAFALAAQMEPQPDNIFLIIDSLPTMGIEPTKESLITAEERTKLFDSAVKARPEGSPINVILFPMEGDPKATIYYWELALRSGGSFLAPPEDWP
jgi:hypothetical protein